MLKRLACFGLIICKMQVATANAQTQIMLEDTIENVNPTVVSIAADISDSEQALGAGMIISKDGYVVTNAHVTEQAEKILLSTSNGVVMRADLVGADEKTDIALLKIRNPKNLEVAEFGDSDSVRVGNQVFVIGNPYGLGNSVSLGIISAKERDIEKGPYDNFIQTDARINQGNSGGPLFNMYGEVIGVSTAIFSTDGNATGVGFATPANVVQWVVKQLKTNGRVIRGWLGVSVQKVRSATPESERGLAISSMEENSPAAKAGLKVGDVILALAEVPLNNPRIFSLEVSKITPDTIVPAIIERDGVELDVQIKIAEMPLQKAEDKNGKNNNLSDNDISAEQQDENAEYAKYLDKAADFPQIGLKAYYDEEKREFLVVEVAKTSDAYKKGIKAGNRFSFVGSDRIFGVEDFRIKIKKAQNKGILPLTLKDKNGIYNVTLRVKK